MSISRANPDLIEEARQLQQRLSERCPCGTMAAEPDIRVIGGADVAYSGEVGLAVIVLLTFPGLQPIGHAVSIRPVLFPYVPGLFGFREAPLYLAAAEKIQLPDLLMVHGHGYAHPRRFGLACHTGVLLGVPTIGIAGGVLCGTAAPPGPEAGSCSLVTEGDEVIGMAVRTHEEQKPIYVSAGYLTDLDFAVRMAKMTSRGLRMPVPLEEAHRISRLYKNILFIQKYRDGPV